MSNKSFKLIKSFNNPIQSSFESLFIDNLEKKTFLTDLKIVCSDGRFFYCHRIVFGVGCKYYFGGGECEPNDDDSSSTSISSENSPEKENNNPQPTIDPLPPTTCIILPEIPSKDFIKILHFIYKGEVNVGEDEISGFFEVAKMLGVKGLVEESDQIGNSDTGQCEIMTTMNGENEEQEIKKKRKRKNNTKEPSSILVRALTNNNNGNCFRETAENTHETPSNNNNYYLFSSEENSNSSSNDKEDIEEEDNFCNKIKPFFNIDDFQTPPTPSTSFTSKNKINLNNRLRATDPRPCPKCGKIYRSAHTLRTHLEDKHTSCPGYRCVLCGTVAKSRNSLHSHMSRQHRGISTKDLPVLPMPAPFDPDLAARLLNSDEQHLHRLSSSSMEIDNNNFNNRSSSTTGSVILDTYLQFIQNSSMYNNDVGEISNCLGDNNTTNSGGGCNNGEVV